MQALSRRNPKLHSRLLEARLLEAGEKGGRYSFAESRSGELVPALLDASGNARPLHSMVDPKREGQKLVLSVLQGDAAPGFFIFFGLGAAYAPQAALEAPGVSHVMAVDFDIDGIAELFRAKDYRAILEDPRFSLWVDPDLEELKEFVRQNYLPALCGGMASLPLKPRVAGDAAGSAGRFDAAAAAVKEAVESVSKDYSVQAHFGLRWFSNIIRNIKNAPPQAFAPPCAGEVAICAAGPSLDAQMGLLAQEKDRGTFIISADTAFPALLHAGVEPDAVVSIDCQHISLYHFLGLRPGLRSQNIPLFLDLASPPLLSRLPFSPFFFTGGHPLGLYAGRHWRPLLRLDTSGANVTYACLSLAERLGARRIRLYGCDFSYPGGKTYARGTYVFPFFSQRQSRLSPLEAQHSAFLYRSPFLPGGDSGRFYETAALRFYRQKIEEKAGKMEAEVVAVPGAGASIMLPEKNVRRGGGAVDGTEFFFPAGQGGAGLSADVFLERYRSEVAALPVMSGGSFWQNLDGQSRLVLATALPLAAAVKHRSPRLKNSDLMEEVKRICLKEIDSQRHLQ